MVAAPSKLQRPAGDRVKTDAKDAVHLAKLLRLDHVTAVTVPSVDTEAARDLVRAREDCRGDLMRARHRLSKLLLRHGHVYTGGSAWTGAHDVWLRQVGRDHLPGRCTRVAFDSDYDAVLTVKARRDRLDTEITAMAADSEFTPVVARLGCLRGVATLTGFALAVEIGDWDRFDGNTIGSFVGLVPSERSSGTTRSRTGAPWRDLPDEFGAFQSVWERHRNWSFDGTYAAMLAAVAEQPWASEEDLADLLSVDSTSVRAHQHAAGALPGPATGGRIESQESAAARAC